MKNLKTNTIIITAAGGLFVVLLAAVFVYQWPGIREGLTVRQVAIDQRNNYTGTEVGITFTYPSEWLLVPSGIYSVGLVQPQNRFKYESWGSADLGLRISSEEVDGKDALVADLLSYLREKYAWEIEIAGVKLDSLTNANGITFYVLKGIPGEVATDAYYAAKPDGYFIVVGFDSTDSPQEIDAYLSVIDSINFVD